MPMDEEIRDGILDVLRHLLAPGIGASLAVMLAVRGLGERWTALAAALALAAGVLAANYFRQTIDFAIEPDRPLRIAELRQVLGWSLESKPIMESEDETSALDEPPPVRFAHYWLPWLALFALIAELLIRCCWLPSGAAWTLRAVISLFAGRLLTPALTRVEAPWVAWALGITIVAEWAILIALSRQWRDGTAPAALALCLIAVSALMMEAHSLKLIDLALYAAAGLAGPALVAWRWPGDTGPALAASAVYLPGLLLTGHQETFSDVPWQSFLLMALAPVALAPMLVPFLVRQTGWKRWLPAFTLIMIPLIVAALLASKAQKIG